MYIYVPGVYARYSFHGGAETPRRRAVRAVRLVTWECGQRGELTLNTWRAMRCTYRLPRPEKCYEPAGILFAAAAVLQQEQLCDQINTANIYTYTV